MGVIEVYHFQWGQQKCVIKGKMSLTNKLGAWRDPLTKGDITICCCTAYFALYDTFWFWFMISNVVSFHEMNNRTWNIYIFIELCINGQLNLISKC